MRMFSSVTTTAALLAGLALSVPGPEPAHAQNRVGFEGRAGMGLPAFDLADRADAGPAVGLDLTYALGDRVALQAGGDIEFLRGPDGAADGGSRSDLTAWHYGVGLEAQLLAPRTTYWRLSTGAGLGGSTYDAEGGGSESAFSLFGSLELGYAFSPEADVFVGVKSWLAFPGGEEGDLVPSTGPLAGVGDTAWSFPVTAGIRFHF